MHARLLKEGFPVAWRLALSLWSIHERLREEDPGRRSDQAHWDKERATCTLRSQAGIKSSGFDVYLKVVET